MLMSATTHDDFIGVEKFGNWDKLVNVTSYVFRFISKIKRKYKSTYLERIHTFFKSPIGLFQMEFLCPEERGFSIFFLLRREQEKAAPTPDQWRRLNLFEDRFKVIKVKTRLTNSELPLKQKEPIFLPKHSWLTHLLVIKAHRDNFHSGPRLTLTSLSVEGYWLSQGRKTALRIIKTDCKMCKNPQNVNVVNCNFVIAQMETDTISLGYEDDCDSVSNYSTTQLADDRDSEELVPTAHAVVVDSRPAAPTASNDNNTIRPCLIVENSSNRDSHTHTPKIQSQSHYGPKSSPPPKFRQFIHTQIYSDPIPRSNFFFNNASFLSPIIPKNSFNFLQNQPQYIISQPNRSDNFLQNQPHQMNYHNTQPMSNTGYFHSPNIQTAKFIDSSGFASPQPSSTPNILSKLFPHVNRPLGIPSFNIPSKPHIIQENIAKPRRVIIVSDTPSIELYTDRKLLNLRCPQSGWLPSEICTTTNNGHINCTGISVRDIANTFLTPNISHSWISNLPDLRCRTLIHCIIIVWLFENHDFYCTAFISKIITLCPLAALDDAVNYHKAKLNDPSCTFNHRKSQNFWNKTTLSKCIKIWKIGCTFASRSFNFQWIPFHVYKSSIYLENPTSHIASIFRLEHLLVQDLSAQLNFQKCKHFFPSALPVNKEVAFMGTKGASDIASNFAHTFKLTQENCQKLCHCPLVGLASNLHFFGPNVKLVFVYIDSIFIKDPSTKQPIFKYLQNYTHFKIVNLICSTKESEFASTNIYELDFTFPHDPNQLTPEHIKSIQEIANSLDINMSIQNPENAKPRPKKSVNNKDTAPRTVITEKTRTQIRPPDGPSTRKKTQILGPQNSKIPSVGPQNSQYSQSNHNYIPLKKFRNSINYFPSILSLLLFTIMLFPIYSNSISPMICKRSVSKFLRIVPPDCKTSSSYHENVHPIELTVYRETTDLKPIKAFHCSIIHQHVHYYKNLLNDPFEIPYQYSLPVTTDECRLMSRQKKCSFGKLISDGGNVYHTSKKLELNWSYWKSPDDAIVDNCFLIPTTIFLKAGDPVTLSSPIADLAGCRYMEQSCQLGDNSTIIWEQSTHFMNRFIQMGRFSGYFNDERRFLANSHEFALTFKNPKDSLDRGKHLVVSDQGLAIALPQYLEMLKIEKKVKKRSAVISETVAAQMTAAQIDTLNMVKSAFTQISNNFCKNLNNLFFSYQGFKSTALARVILNSSLVEARWVSDSVLEYWKCYRVPLQNITFTKSPNCFKKVPINITLNHEIISTFLDPHTGIISQYSAMGDCSILRIISVELNGILYQIDQLNGKVKKISNENIQNYFPGSLLLLSEELDLDAQIFHNYTIKNLTDPQTLLLYSFSTMNQFKLVEKMVSSPNDEKGPHGGYNPNIHIFEMPSLTNILLLILNYWVKVYVISHTIYYLYRIYHALRWVIHRAEALPVADISDVDDSDESRARPKRRRHRKNQRRSN
jgi:hypothetical protein